jgi:hypothetical protein
MKAAQSADRDVDSQALGLRDYDGRKDPQIYSCCQNDRRSERHAERAFVYGTNSTCPALTLFGHAHGFPPYLPLVHNDGKLTLYLSRSESPHQRQYALKLNMNSLLRGCLKHCGIFCVFRSLVVACPTRCGGLGLTKYGISATRVVCTVNKGAFCVAFGTSIVLTTAVKRLVRQRRREATWLFLFFLSFFVCLTSIYILLHVPTTKRGVPCTQINIILWMMVSAISYRCTWLEGSTCWSSNCGFEF